MLNIKVAWSFKYKKLHLPIKNPKIKYKQKHKLLVTKLTKEFLSINGCQ